MAPRAQSTEGALRTAMTLSTNLMRLAHAHGVVLGYTSYRGDRVLASRDALLAALSALGAPVTHEAEVAGALRERRVRRAAQLCEPVLVAWDGLLASIELRTLEGPTPGLLTLRLRLETGEERVLRRDAAELPLLSSAPLEGRRAVRRRWPLGEHLPLGYHQLELRGGGHEACATVIAAPRRCTSHALDGTPVRADERGWGAFLPTYALRDPSDWGIGDYSRLGDLLQWTADQGGRCVATLPLLAGFFDETLHEPSPYAPASRLFWNELHVDPEAEPGWRTLPGVAALVDAPAFQAERRALQQAELLDYPRVARLKRPVIEAMAEAAERTRGARRAALDHHLASHPLLPEYARFRATCEARGTPWTHWPERLRGGQLRESELDPRAVRYHVHVQLMAHQQLQRAAEAARQRDVGLLLDLPLGVHSCGYDTWRWPALFAKGISAGAPPDDFFTQGQSWGFPPLIPDVARADGHAYLRATLRHHLQFATALRIDHIMSLHRLYWVPHGLGATEGVYVRNHPQELYAVLCLESHRHGAAIVGEDLGTVPRALRPNMARHDVRRLSVLQFGIGGSGTQRVDARGVASLGTHDTPTFTAFREALDIEDFRSLGLMDGPTARRARAARRRLVGEMRHWLDVEQALPLGAPDDELAPAVLGQLGGEPHPLVLVNLEDLWHERRPQNVPGTHHERPNWRRRARHGPAALPALPAVGRALEVLRAARRAPPRTLPDGAFSVFDALDLPLFRHGRHLRLHDKLGGRLQRPEDRPGAHFALWAPQATAVAVVGDFNAWDPQAHPLQRRAHELWECFVQGAHAGQGYRFAVTTSAGTHELLDPVARRQRPGGPGQPPASLLVAGRHVWDDASWLAARASSGPPPLHVLDETIPADLDARGLLQHILSQIGPRGGVHVVLPPWMQFRDAAGRWLTSDFAPAPAFGDPDDVKALVAELHRREVGVVLGWPAPGTPVDELPAPALGPLNGHAPVAPRAATEPEEVLRGRAMSYLLSSAAFWLDEYHLDGLCLRMGQLAARAGQSNPLALAAEVNVRLFAELPALHPGVVLLNAATQGGLPLRGVGQLAPQR